MVDLERCDRARVEGFAHIPETDIRYRATVRHARTARGNFVSSGDLAAKIHHRKPRDRGIEPGIAVYRLIAFYPDRSLGSIEEVEGHED